MALSEFAPGLIEVVIGTAVCFAFYHVYWQLTVGASRGALIKERGCKPLNANKEYSSFPNNILGIKGLLENLDKARNHQLLDHNRSRFQKLGNTFRIKIMTDDLIMTCEPKNIQTILALSFDHWALGPKRRRTFDPLFGAGIFTTDGAAWKHSREMLRPNFSRSQVGNLTSFEVHVSRLIDQIPKDGSIVDLQDLFFKLTIDSATDFLFGESTNSLIESANESENARFAESFNRSQELIAHCSRSGKWAQTYHLNSRPFTSDCKFCHDFVDKFVRKGLARRRQLDLDKAADSKDDARYIFLDELVKQTDDPIQIRSELLNILLAGRDTTASLLSDVWFILARRPDIWTKLREEVDALGGEKPMFQSLKDMKYLRWMLNETLRLYPIVASNSRIATRDTVLPLGGGPDHKSPLFIPAGQVVQWSLWAMHRRTDLFSPDAEEFRPERWEHLKPGWEYLPFNGGPRICLGQQFALTEASYTIVRLMQAFSAVEARDDRPWMEWLTLTCAIHNGTLVGLTPK